MNLNDMENDPEFLRYEVVRAPCLKRYSSLYFTSPHFTRGNFLDRYLASLGLRDNLMNLSIVDRQKLMQHQQGETQAALLQAGRAVTKFALPPVFALGVLGNLLSILVLARCVLLLRAARAAAGAALVHVHVLCALLASQVRRAALEHGVLPVRALLPRPRVAARGRAGALPRRRVRRDRAQQLEPHVQAAALRHLHTHAGALRSPLHTFCSELQPPPEH